MLGLTRKDWLNLLPILFIVTLVSTFRAGATGLLDPTEPFYALTAKEMLQRGDWLTPTLFGQPQFEKPVFAYWVYLALFRLFGIHEWAARLGPTLAALGVLVSTAVLAKALFSRSRTVWLSAAVLASAGLFITLSRVVLTDMFLCLFTTASFAAFAVGWRNSAARPIAWRLFFIFMALGFLTKGPLGVLLPLGSVFLYSAFSQGEIRARTLPWKSGIFLFLAVALPWYAIAAAQHDWFLPHFFMHENVRRFFVAEHGSLNKPYFYPLVLLFGFFPWSFVLIPALWSQMARLERGTTVRRNSRLFLLVSIAGMFVFFSTASSKLISYILPLFPLLAVLTADWLNRLIPVLERRPSSRVLHSAFFAGWVLLPSTLVGSVIAYERVHSLGLTRQMLMAGLLCVLPCIGAYVLLCLKRFRLALAVISAMAAVFSAAAFGWILPLAERFFSSRPMIEDFSHDGFDPTQGTLLGSKMSVRGVSYYSGNSNVAVVSGNPKAFYTSHSIPMISTPADLDLINRDHYPVYGILRPKEIKHLRGILDGRYELIILDANPQRAIVRLERRKI